MAARNSDEKQIIDIISKHLNKYNAVTFSITNTLWLEIEKSITNCIDELLDLYLDETQYRQIFTRPDGTIIYTSNKNTYNFSKKFLALGYISFIVEMIIFYHIYCEIYQMTSNGKEIIKPQINPNTLSNQNQNLLLSVFIDQSPPYQYSPRVYSDSILTDFNSGGFMNLITQFQNKLELVFRSYCTGLLIRIQNKYNTKTMPEIINIFYSQTINGISYIYDNWSDRLIDLISNNSRDKNIRDAHKKDIEQLIFDELDKHATDWFKYLADGTGFFSFMYLKNPADPAINGSCITSTYIEHFILHRLYIESSRIKLICQSVNKQRYHAVYTYTQQTIYNNLLDYKTTKSISHWFTNLSDVSSIKVNNAKVIRETNENNQQKLNRKQFSELYNKINNNKVNGKTLRDIKPYKDNPILKPQSIINNIDDYFRLFIYPVLDINIVYFVKNSQLIYQKYAPLEGLSAEYYGARGIRMLTILGDKLYRVCEDKLSKFNKNNRNKSISLIKNNLINILDRNLDTTATQAERQQTRRNIDEVNTLNVNDIVRNLLNPNPVNRFEFDFTNKPSIYFDRAPNEVIDDEETFLKDAMTKFVNNHFYNNDEVTYNFFYIIHNIFTNGIYEYIRQKNLPPDCIVFAFKGGNIMRLVITKELENNFSEKQMLLILDSVKDIFKKSDSDFQIYVKNLTEGPTPKTIAEMDEIYADINKLTYLLLNRIRNIVLLNPEVYINFMQYSNDYKKQLFNELLESINNSTDKQESDKYRDCRFTEIRFQDITVGDAELSDNPYIISDKTDMSTIFTYHNKNSRGDMLVYVHNPQPNEEPLAPGHTRVAVTQNKYLYNFGKHDDILDKLIEKNIIYNNNSNTNLYISYNNSINMRKGFIDVHFNLLRIKINFSLTYKKLHPNGNTYTHILNVPGEYIDVSIPNYTNQDPVYVMSHMSDPNPPVIKYRLNINDKPKIQINGFSYLYFIKDLETVLFYQNSPPWLDKKYKKRIIRLMILYFVELFKNIITQEEQDVYSNLLRDIQHLIGTTIIATLSDRRIRKDIPLLESTFKDFKRSIKQIISTYDARINHDLTLIKLFKLILISEIGDTDPWAYYSKYDRTQINGINRGIIQRLNDNPDDNIPEYYDEVLKFYKTIFEQININIVILMNMFHRNYSDINEFTKIAGGHKKKLNKKLNKKYSVN